MAKKEETGKNTIDSFKKPLEKNENVKLTDKVPEADFSEPKEDKKESVADIVNRNLRHQLKK